MRTPENSYHHFDNPFYPFPDERIGQRHTSAATDSLAKKPAGNGKQGENALQPKLILASDVKKQPVRWLWENKILRGALSLITGLSGVTKTYLTVYMASCITNGKNWADGSPCELGSVLFFYGEEGIADVYLDRFEANGVDQSKVVFWDGMIDEEGKSSDADVSLKMVGEIETAINVTAEKTGVPVRMVIVDPISNYLDSNENSNTAVRSVLKRLQRLADKTGVAFIFIQHINKSSKAHAQQKVLGSTAIVATCRAVWGVYIDPDDKNARIFAPIKINCGYNHTAVSYRISSGGKVEIIDGSIPDLTADDIESAQQAARREARNQRPSKREECATWLWDVLIDGEKPVNQIYELGKAQGYSERTIDRAKSELEIGSRRVGFGKEGHIVWETFCSEGC